MPSKLPKNIEKKSGFTSSIERSWKDRFILACYNKSVADNTVIIASNLVREFIINTTVEMEEYIEKKKKVSKQ